MAGLGSGDSKELLRRTPDAQVAIVASREDELGSWVPRGGRLAPLRGGRGAGEDIDGAYPVVFFDGGEVQGRDGGADVLDAQNVFG